MYTYIYIYISNPVLRGSVQVLNSTCLRLGLAPELGGKLAKAKGSKYPDI